MTVVYVLRHHWVRKGGFELLSMALHCGTSAGIERLSERETCRLPSLQKHPKTSRYMRGRITGTAECCPLATSQPDALSR
jgi:hypothetical protein